METLRKSDHPSASLFRILVCIVPWTAVKEKRLSEARKRGSVNFSGNSRWPFSAKPFSGKHEELLRLLSRVLRQRPGQCSPIHVDSLGQLAGVLVAGRGTGAMYGGLVLSVERLQPRRHLLFSRSGPR